MENLKNPETVITLANTAALLGVSLYFYKKINGLEVELNKHSEHLTVTVKKVREMIIYKKHIATLGNAVKQLNGQLQSQNRDIATLKELVKHQSRQIDELQASLQKIENAPEIKLTGNPHLRNLDNQQAQFSARSQLGGQQGQFGGQQFPGQQGQFGGQQFPGQQGQFGGQQFPGQQQGQFGGQQFSAQQGQQGQFGGQQFPGQQGQFSGQQFPGQQFPTQQPQFPGQPRRQPQPMPQNPQYPQTGFDEDMLNFGLEDDHLEGEDEDAAIQAVRQARNQQQGGDLFFN